MLEAILFGNYYIEIDLADPTFVSVRLTRNDLSSAYVISEINDLSTQLRPYSRIMDGELTVNRFYQSKTSALMQLKMLYVMEMYIAQRLAKMVLPEDLYLDNKNGKFVTRADMASRFETLYQQLNAKEEEVERYYSLYKRSINMSQTEVTRFKENTVLPGLQGLLSKVENVLPLQELIADIECYLASQPFLSNMVRGQVFLKINAYYQKQAVKPVSIAIVNGIEQLLYDIVRNMVGIDSKSTLQEPDVKKYLYALSFYYLRDKQIERAQYYLELGFAMDQGKELSERISIDPRDDISKLLTTSSCVALAYILHDLDLTLSEPLIDIVNTAMPKFLAGMQSHTLSSSQEQKFLTVLAENWDNNDSCHSLRYSKTMKPLLYLLAERVEQYKLSEDELAVVERVLEKTADRTLSHDHYQYLRGMICLQRVNLNKAWFYFQNVSLNSPDYHQKASYELANIFFADDHYKGRAAEKFASLGSVDGKIMAAASRSSKDNAITDVYQALGDPAIPVANTGNHISVNRLNCLWEQYMETMQNDGNHPEVKAVESAIYDKAKLGIYNTRGYYQLVKRYYLSNLDSIFATLLEQYFSKDFFQAKLVSASTMGVGMFNLPPQLAVDNTTAETTVTLGHSRRGDNKKC